MTTPSYHQQSPRARNLIDNIYWLADSMTADEVAALIGKLTQLENEKRGGRGERNYAMEAIGR